MTRTALIIGLGGTGQWILTYLKRDLIETNNGMMPDNVKLLCFNLFYQDSEKTSESALKKGEEDVVVGGIKLETDVENVCISSDIFQPTETKNDDPKKEKEDHRNPQKKLSWFTGKDWFLDQKSAQFDLVTGSGQFRKFGRIGVSNYFNPALKSEVWERLDLVIKDITTKLEGQEKLEICVVSSLVGGTGSRLSIDIALLIGDLVRNIPISIGGYFALPHVFDKHSTNGMGASTFAAWRELNRFMIIRQNSDLPILAYDDKDEKNQHPEIQIRTFDTCYIFDGIQRNHQFETDMEFVVYPSVANAIIAILDDNYQQDYAEHSIKNLSSENLNKPNMPFSGFAGAYTIKFPVYDALQDYSIRLIRKWLEILLDPIFDESNKKKIVRFSNISPYNPKISGHEESLSLLTTPRVYEKSSEEPTTFYYEIANVINNGDVINHNFIDWYAKGTWQWQLLQDGFTNLGNRGELSELATQVCELMKLRVDQIIKTSKDADEKPFEFPNRAGSEVDCFKRDTYGVISVNGELSGGNLRKMLEKCGDAQYMIFRRLVDTWLLDILMSGNKRGRLGYAADFLNGAIEHLENFVEFLNEINEIRSKRYMLASYTREDAWRDVLSNSNKKILGIFDHPYAHASQEKFIEAEQMVCDILKDGLFYIEILRTVKAMKAYCEEACIEVSKWLQTFGIGSSVNGITGLFSYLEELDSNTRQQNETIKPTSELPSRMDTDYGFIDNKEIIVELVDAVKWTLSGNDEKECKLELFVELQNQPPITFENSTDRKKISDETSLAQHNYSQIKSIVTQYFLGENFNFFLGDYG
jgi:hypothetical protein